ncbi:MAG: flavodoxin domain-containing protein [Caldilineaceae bacterium]
MRASILVTYATNSSPTQEVAKAVAETFLGKGLATDLQAMTNVRTLVGYHAVVLGAPLVMGRWHKDARHFLSRHRTQLAERRVAIFALGPVQDVAKEWQAAQDQLHQELAQFPWLRPMAVEIFGNKSEPIKPHFPLSLMTITRQTPTSDIRDWMAIQAWANQLAGRFQAT